MSIGIYLLTFGENIYYVGLSTSIESRIEGHLSSLKKGNSPKKLQDAYAAFGTPSASILEECSIAELPSREKYFISKYDSYCRGANSNRGGACNASAVEVEIEELYSSIVKILHMYVSNNVTIDRLAEYSNLSTDIIVKVLAGRKYFWAGELFPEVYGKALLKYASNHNVPEEGYPKIVSNKGEIVQIPSRGATKFAKEHNLNQANLSKLLRGKISSCGEWKLCYHS